MDILYLALLIGFVALSVGLVYFFENLRRPK
jgi:vacuolar-type H+-ATPase subunit I/STV1